MFWSLQEGIIHTKRLEINVVHHCNLSCCGCSHMSPLMPKFFISPDRLFHDLSILSRHCHTECVSLLGGEPLLHPNLKDIVDIVRSSGITDHIRMVTNGVLLNRMPEQIWKSLDEVHVSLYPSTHLEIRDLAALNTYAKRNATLLKLRYQDYFRECFLEMGNKDESLVRRIYLTCILPREGCCHTLVEGYYFKCSQAAFIPLVYKDRPDLMAASDGINIHGREHLTEDLAGYFSTNVPLAACRYCLGSVGREFTPQQISHKPPSPSIPKDEWIDWKYLQKLEGKKGVPIPKWLQEVWNKTSILMTKLPPSVLLSPTWRRTLSLLGEMKRNYLR